MANPTQDDALNRPAPSLRQDRPHVNFSRSGGLSEDDFDLLRRFMNGEIKTEKPETPDEREARLRKPILGNPVLPGDAPARGAQAAQGRKPSTLAQQRRQQFWANRAAQTAQQVARTSVYLEGLPQPGGIGLILFTIIVILFAIMPMNADGDTRITLLWLAIRGKVQLPSSNSIDTTAGASGPGGSLQTAAAAAVSKVASLVQEGQTPAGKQALQSGFTAGVQGATGTSGATGAGASGILQGIEIGIGTALGIPGVLPYSSGGG